MIYAFLVNDDVLYDCIILLRDVSRAMVNDSLALVRTIAISFSSFLLCEISKDCGFDDCITV